MELRRVGRRSVTEEIIDYLKEEILKQALKPGQQLPSEEGLASQLGVARGTIREALRVLQYLGFIERKGKTTVVSLIATEKNLPNDFIERIHFHRDVMKMIEVRKIVEPKAAALAAENAGPDELSQIGNNLISMENQVSSLEDFIRFDNEFHLSVIRASGNHILLELMKSIQELMRENQSLVLMKSHSIQPRSLEFHRSLYYAIRDGKDDEAFEIMENHVLDIEREMYLIIREESGGKNGNT